MKKVLSIVVLVFAFCTLFAQIQVKTSKMTNQSQSVKYSPKTGLEIPDEIITPTILRNGAGIGIRGM